MGLSFPRSDTDRVCGLHQAHQVPALAIYDTVELGRILTLDNVIRQQKYSTCTMKHRTCSLFSHESPEHVLIIGGGDGGTLREVMRHLQ